MKRFQHFLPKVIVSGICSRKDYCFSDFLVFYFQNSQLKSPSIRTGIKAIPIQWWILLTNNSRLSKISKECQENRITPRRTLPMKLLERGLWSSQNFEAEMKSRLIMAILGETEEEKESQKYFHFFSHLSRMWKLETLCVPYTW